MTDRALIPCPDCLDEDGNNTGLEGGDNMFNDVCPTCKGRGYVEAEK